MSDPGTTYRSRDEIQKVRSQRDPIRGLQRYLTDWGVATEDEMKVFISLNSMQLYLHFHL